MSFLLSEEQKELQSMVRSFVKAEIIPHAAEWDRRGEFPKDVFKKVVDMGLTTLTFPEALGGAGLGAREAVIVSEELGYGDAGFAVSTGSCTLGVEPLLIGGSDQQKAMAAEFLNGGGMAAFGLTEPEAGSDAAALRTTAVKDGDEYVLNGAKCFITNGGIADLYTIFATIDKEKGANALRIKRSNRVAMKPIKPCTAYGKPGKNEKSTMVTMVAMMGVTTVNQNTGI